MLVKSEAREKCITIIENFSEEQLLYVAASLDAMHKMLEASDEAACLEMYKNSFDDDNDEPEDFELFVNSLGITRK